MKKFLPFLILICLIVALWYLTITTKENEAPLSAESARSCYEFNQTATEEAPYTVRERIDIEREGNQVTGTKSGTQAGPDMTNGYTGTLTGSVTNDTLNATYSYVIEGSSQKEEEIYTVDEYALIKHRYVLKEEGGILVPDMETTPRDLIYIKADCASF